MESWLKKAEEEELRKVEQKERIREKIHGRRELILENYRANKKLYDAIITQFQDMVDRVNALPFRKRQLFGKLRISPKTTRLQNHLHIISSSRKLSMNKLLLLTPSFRKARLKHVRVAFLSVSKQKGSFDLEVKESLLEKKSLKKDGSGVENRKEDSHKRTDFLYEIPFSSWTDELAYEVVDFLVFEKDMESLPFDKFEYKDLSAKPSYKGSQH